jgi:hypothetical protein
MFNDKAIGYLFISKKKRKMEACGGIYLVCREAPHTPEGIEGDIVSCDIQLQI